MSEKNWSSHVKRTECHSLLIWTWLLQGCGPAYCYWCVWPSMSSVQGHPQQVMKNFFLRSRQEPSRLRNLSGCQIQTVRICSRRFSKKVRLFILLILGSKFTLVMYGDHDMCQAIITLCKAKTETVKLKQQYVKLKLKIKLWYLKT